MHLLSPPSLHVYGAAASSHLGPRRVICKAAVTVSTPHLSYRSTAVPLYLRATVHCWDRT